MLGQLSQCSDWSAGLMIKELWSDSWQGLRFLSPIRCPLNWLHPIKPKILPCCYCIILELTQPLIWWVTGALNLGAEQPWAEADHSLLSSANVTREHSHIFTPPPAPDAFRAHKGATLLLHYSFNSMTVPNPFWHSQVLKLMCGVLTSLYFGIIHH